MIKPTIGRVVWYYPTAAEPGAAVPGGPLAAIIACVWSDTCVNLAVFDCNGHPFANPPTSVLLIQDDAPVPTGGGYCTWMPYQVGQAAKTEELQKQLAAK